jgi:beta-glucosidase
MNETKALPLKAGTKVYFETYLTRRDQSPSTVYQSEANAWDIEFVDSPEKADVVLVWIIAKSKSLFASDGSPLTLSLSNNGVDVEYVNKLSAKKPTIIAINFTNPWVIDEVYSPSVKNVKGILATFGTTPEALLDIVTGKFKPTGKMPFATPISESAAQNQKSDVPGNMEGDDYSLFKFDEGLTYDE